MASRHLQWSAPLASQLSLCGVHEGATRGKVPPPQVGRCWRFRKGAANSTGQRNSLLLRISAGVLQPRVLPQVGPHPLRDPGRAPLAFIDHREPINTEP